MEKRLNVVVGLQVLTLLLIIWCCRSCRDDDSEANLVINHEDTAAWITFSNMFTGNVGEGKLTYWKGVLVQLGDYIDGARDFESVEFYTEGASSPVLRLSAEDTGWSWIDIVSERGGATQPVDNPDLIFSLYPNDYTSTGCDLLDLCADPSSELLKPCYFCGGMEDLPCGNEDNKIPSSCLRRRRIHGSQDPTHVLTYWEGDHGYEVEVVPENGDHNRISFTFLDGFSVRVYGPAEGASPVMTEIGDSKDGLLADVVRVVVTDKEGPPEGGKHEDPMWPPYTP